MKKMMAALIAAVLAALFTVNAAAGETLEAETDTAAQQIRGFYIENYAGAKEKVNLSLVAQPDLTALSEQAECRIYDFRDDGTVVQYMDGKLREGSYTASDAVLTLRFGEEESVFDYRFIDGLLVVTGLEESSILYDFDLMNMDYITMEDYSVIEIDRKSVEVSESDLQNYINSVLQGQTTYQEITEGTVEKGDIITISFQGVLEGEEEPFEGGSSEGLTLQLGSGALIDTYEEQLEGQEIGRSVEVHITFPEDYAQIEGLAGKKAVFTTLIQSKTVAETPQLTDEWVQGFTTEYFAEPLETVEEFEEHSRAYLENYLLHTAMVNALAAKTTITGYNEDLALMLADYSARNISQLASSNGMDETAYAKGNGYDSPAAFARAQAIAYMNIAMIVNRVMMDENLTYTMEDLESSMEDYVRLSFGDAVTVEQYRENSGEAGIWMYTNVEFKYNLAMSALEDRVVLVESEDPAPEETKTSEPAAEE